MKKKHLTNAKKTLSVFMAVMMLMSCWVFVPAEHNHASAIDAGDAVTAYNKELLNQIKTDPDTNMVTTIDNRYKRTDNGKAGDTNSNVTSTHLSSSYQNVLNFNNGNIVTSGTGSAVTIIKGTANADSVQVWYPDTVLMYDGGKAKMAVLLEADSNGSSLRTASCYLSGDSDGLYLGFDESNPYWRGHSDDDPAVMYCLWIGSSGYQATTNGTKHSQYIFGCKNWSFSATHLYFTGTMSDTEWVRTYNPKWSYRGGTNDDSVHGPVKANGHTIYVMNIQGYKRLVQDIISKKGTLNGKEGQYTRDSLQRFVNACNKITKDLAPKNFVSTTSNNVTSWASQMSTAYTELNNAYKGLTKRNVNVGYENLFSINDWAQSLSPNLQSSSSVEIAVENNDTVKIYKNSAGGEVTTGSSYPNAHVATRYSIPVTGGKDYTVRYDIEASVSGTAQSEVFMFWYDANNNPVNNTAGSATFNNKGFGNTGACSVTFTAPASATKAEIRFDNDCPSSGSTLRFKNIAVYPAERNTAVEVDSWSTRPVTKTVQYGSTLSGTLAVPVRNGYTFNGWYIDNVNVNGVKDSGEEVTDAAGNVTKTITVNDSINLYADWKPLPMDIGYDNIFSLAEWAKTNSTKASSANGTIAYDVMAGTITAESTANGEVYSNYGTGSDQYVIAVEPNTEYIFEADMDLVKGDKGQLFVFFYNASGSGVSGAIYNGAAQTNTHIGIYPTTEGTSSITFTTPADCTKMAFRVGATNVGTKAVYSNIGFYKKADYDAYAKDYAAVRVPFNFGDTTQLSLVPVRAGYKFEGWYTAAGDKLTSVTGLKASDTVYAKWVQMFTVTFKNGNGDVIKTQEVAPGANATAPANPVKNPDTNTEYVFDKWDTAFTNVQSDITVNAVFKTKDHSLVKSYVSGSTCTAAATYTQYCTSCNFTWNGVLEDATMPALGHTYDRDPATFTVITGTSTGKTDDDLHTIKCNECDATKTVKHNFQLDTAHPATSATCIVAGETYYKCACLETKTEVGSVNPDNHVNTKIINAEDAACEKEGYTGDKYCNDCKKIVATGKATDALDHVYTTYTSNGDATCFADGTESALCDLCKDETKKDTRTEVGSQLTHKYTNYVYNEGTAKCEVNGTETAYCDHGCGTEDTREAANSALEHDFTGDYKNNENGTHSFLCKNGCGNYGATVDCVYGAWTTDNATTHSHTCTTCGYTPAAEAHDWSAWTTVGGSATEKAEQTRSCNVCGKVENTECNYVVADHKDETCEAPEITTYECSDCKHGYSVIGEGAKGHKFEGDVVNNGEGKHSFKCLNNCGEIGFETTKNMSVPCSDWTYANTEAGKHTATCDDCGYVKTEDCSGGEATCTAQAVCQFCNTAYGDKAAHSYKGNTYFDGVVKAKDATCTAQAEYYTYCEACKETSKDTADEDTFKYGDLLAHTYTGNTEYLYKAAEAKCGVNETYYVYCADCQASSEGTAEEATFEKADTALTHKYDGTIVEGNNDGTHTITCANTNEDGWACDSTIEANCADSALSTGGEEATCISQGYTKYQCTLCGYNWNANYTDALGHNYTEKIYDEAHLKAAANCEHANIYYYDCSRCDKNAKDETDTDKYTTLTYLNGKVRAHSFQSKVDEKYIAAEATCFTAAWYYDSCKYEDCGKSALEIDGESTTKKFQSGSALAHDWAEVEDEEYLATPSDCVNNATYYKVCSLCNTKGTGTWEKEDSKSGHKLTHTEAKAADCENAGNHEYWYCDTCKKYFKNKDATEAFGKKSETEIAKLGHDIVEVAYKAPTCEEDGYPDYEYCTKCDYKKYTDDLDDDYKATGHNFTGNWVYDAVLLCHSKKCLNGCNKTGMVVDGKQVEYKVTYNENDEAVIEGGEKCVFDYEVDTKDGVHTHANKCVCGNENSYVYADDETRIGKVEPTCTEKGYENHKCPDCGATWINNVVDKKDHTASETPVSNGNGTHSIVCTVEGCGVQLSTEKCEGGQATCKDKAVCDKCKEEYGEKGTHVYAEDSEWIYQNDATCGVDGTETNECTACGETVSRTAEGTALKHAYTEYGFTVPDELKETLAQANIEIKAPTCGAQGLALSYCTNCYAYKTQTKAKDDNAHVWEEDATSEDGYKWTATGNCGTGVTLINKCTMCDKVRSQVGDATHQWVDEVIVKATCMEAGHKLQRCSVCGFAQDVLVENDPALKHTWEREGFDGELIVDKEATCAHAGRGHYVCGDCNEKSENIAIEKIAHAWDLNADGLIDKYNKNGDSYELAENGDFYYYETIDLNEGKHNFIFVEPAAPTCDAFGHDGYFKCLSCSYDQSEEAAWIAQYKDNAGYKATGHADTDGDGKCDSCKQSVDSANGEAKCGCICHKESGFMKFIYKIIRFFWKIFGIGKSCECGTVHY